MNTKPIPEPRPVRLDAGPYINPFLLRALPYTGIVEHPHGIVIAGQLLTGNEPLQVGQAVRVTAGQYVELHYQADLDARRLASQQRQEMNDQQERDRLTAQRNAARRASQLFYEQHPIPFAFSIEIKERLSGLSESSNGDGWGRNTVCHVFTHEAVAFGRLKRSPHQFLCSPVRAQGGANWSDSLGRDTYTNDDGVRPVPTCKQCLAILARIETNPATGCP